MKRLFCLATSLVLLNVNALASHPNQHIVRTDRIAFSQMNSQPQQTKPVEQVKRTDRVVLRKVMQDQPSLQSKRIARTDRVTVIK